MRTISRKSTVIFVLSISIVFASPVRSQEKPSTEKVRIAVATSSMAFLVPFVAKDRGIYLKHGSEVELIQMRPNIAMAALLGGDPLRRAQPSGARDIYQHQSTVF